jgi:hypothetical protein
MLYYLNRPEGAWWHGPGTRSPGRPRLAGQVRKGNRSPSAHEEFFLRPEAGMFLEPVTAAIVAALSSGGTFVLKRGRDGGDQERVRRLL